MAGTQDNLDKLKDLIASDPNAMQGAAASGDVKEASKALAQYAASKGISLTPEEIEKAFTSNDAPASSSEPLDDEALDNVSGGGSPYCILTKGCYCILTGKI